MRDEQLERAGPTTERVPRRATDLVHDVLGSFRGVVVQGARQMRLRLVHVHHPARSHAEIPLDQID